MGAALRYNETPYGDRMRADQWFVRAVPAAEARPFVVEHHYAKGASNTAVYTFGLFNLRAPLTLAGVTWWLPPTRVAAESVDRARWRQVLALSRMAVLPGAPKNTCSFMLARSVRAIRRDRRFVALVTYADESQGHSGAVYRASNWQYVGRTKPSPLWLDPRTGRQVAKQATKSRTVAEMLALGYERGGSFCKHKFVLDLT